MLPLVPGTNWAGNYRYRSADLRRPTSLAEVRAIVAQADKVHVLGSRHSFNDIADTRGTLISLAALEPEFAIAANGRSISVSGGVSYGGVAQLLSPHGLSLRNYASLPHISLAGAMSTGTHGSGDRNGCLATDVLDFDVVLASGDIRHCSPASLGDDFAGTVVSLGALGVISRVTLAVVPTFEVRQNVYENLPWHAFEEHFDEITGYAYSVSMFTDFGPGGIDQLWVKSRVGDRAPDDARAFGARAATGQRHPIRGMDAINATAQLGVAGLPHDRLPHFRIGYTPSNGDEIQSEYLIDRADARLAVIALRRLAPRLAPLLRVAEIRSIAADDLWLSPSTGRDTVGLHFTWVRDQAAVEAVLNEIEAVLAPFDARPHWGKLFVARADRLRGSYPMLTRFGELALAWDPDRKFGNDFLNRYLPA